MNSCYRPYFRPVFDGRGRYYLLCPECGRRVLGTGRTEDQITKMAIEVMWNHWKKHHRDLYDPDGESSMHWRRVS